MEPVFKRDVPEGGTHALIVGVSDYLHLPLPGVAAGAAVLGLNKLRSAALAAWRFYDWLKAHADDLPCRLATVHLLLSPSAEELAAAPEMAGASARAGFDAIRRTARAWRGRAKDNRDRTIFYFAGHGVGAEDKNVILLADDFADPNAARFAHSFSLRDLDDGMAASEETPLIAQTQFYFVDACRDTDGHVQDFKTIRPGVIFDDLNQVDLRQKCTLFATSHGLRAEGVAGRGSPFCEALLEAFENASERSAVIDGSRRWLVTSDTIRDFVADRLRVAGVEQRPRALADSSEGLLFRALPAPPLVEFHITLDPDSCAPNAAVRVTDAAGMQHDPRETAPDHPFLARSVAGITTVAAEAPDFEPQSTQDVLTFRTGVWPIGMPPCR